MMLGKHFSDVAKIYTNIEYARNKSWLSSIKLTITGPVFHAPIAMLSPQLVLTVDLIKTLTGMVVNVASAAIMITMIIAMGLAGYVREREEE